MKWLDYLTPMYRSSFLTNFGRLGSQKFVHAVYWYENISHSSSRFWLLLSPNINQLVIWWSISEESTIFWRGHFCSGTGELNPRKLWNWILWIHNIQDCFNLRAFWCSEKVHVSCWCKSTDVKYSIINAAIKSLRFVWSNHITEKSLEILETLIFLITWRSRIPRIVCLRGFLWTHIKW